MAYDILAPTNQVKSSELNKNFTASGKIHQVYIGSGWDASGTSSTTTSHELNSISSANLGNADYLVIELTYRSITPLTTAAQSGSTTLKIETKEIAGSYSDTLGTTTINNASTASGGGDDTGTATLKWVHTLTAGEKSNGVQVKVTGGISVTGSASCSITNLQTVLQTRAS